jgi:uracil-DNA glycosylase
MPPWSPSGAIDWQTGRQTSRRWMRAGATLVQGFLGSESGRALSSRLVHALSAGQTIFPAEPFKALELDTPGPSSVSLFWGKTLTMVRARRMAWLFRCHPGCASPQSTQHFQGASRRALVCRASTDGSLVRWAQQGVLLLNTCLTVEAGQAGSHAGWGWEVLTDALITAVAESPAPVVFMLWGAHAQAKKKILDAVPGSSKHLVLQANHPSPLSAMRPPLPFIGCGHFASAQLFAAQIGRNAIAW